MIRKLLKNQRLREVFLYCVVGALTTVVNYVVYFLFTRLAPGAPQQNAGLAGLIMGEDFQNVGLALLGTLIAWAAAVAFAFYPNRRWVFRSRSREVAREIREFVGARVLSLGADLGMMLLFLSVFGLNDMLAKLLSQVVVIAANYFASKFWIFKKREGSSRQP